MVVSSTLTQKFWVY